MTPSLEQSGESRTQGDDHQDRLRDRAAVAGRSGLALPARTADRRDTAQNRQAGQPDHVLQIALASAQRRLYRTHQRMRGPRQTGPNVTTVAVARELAGFLWAAATAP